MSKGFALAAVVLVAAAGLLLTGPAGAHERAHVRSVKTVVAANPGATVPFSARLATRSKRTVSFWLSRDSKRGGGDTLLTRAHARGKSASAAAGLSAKTKLGRYHIVACLRRSCAASRAFKVRSAPASSADLIDAALAKHKLSEQKALLYRIKAGAQPLGVPARYRGNLTPMGDEGAVDDVIDASRTLSKATRAKLVPYLVPPASRIHHSGKRGPSRAETDKSLCDDYNPIDKHSNWIAYAHRQGWDEPMKDWRTFVSPDGHVRFWYENFGGDPYMVPYKRDAHMLANATGRIWGTYKAVLGREPLSDEKAGCFWGTDSKLDVYIEPTSYPGFLQGLTVTYPPNCAGSPAFITLLGMATRWDYAHELFHAFQDAFPMASPHCGKYNWISEGTANWGAHRVFPSDHEKEYSEYDFGRFIRATVDAPTDFDSHAAPYETWPLWLFMSQTQGDAGIRSVWQHVGDADPVRAVDEAMQGGWKKQWPEFTKAAWNQDPWHPFRDWDKWNEQPLTSTLKVALGNKKTADFDVPVNKLADYNPHMEGLQRAYTDVTFADDVKSIQVKNPRPGNPNWGFQAYLHLADGHWEYKDISAKKTLDLCRDNADENVDRMVLMMSNATFPEAKVGFLKAPPKLTVRSDCDHYFKVTQFTGSMSYTAKYRRNSYPGDTCTYSGSEQYTMSSRDSGQPTDGSTNDVFGLILAPSRLDGGTVKYSSSCGDPPACQDDLPAEDDMDLLQVSHDPGAETATVGLEAFGRDINDYFCHDRFADDWVSGDDQWLNLKVPWSELTGTQPFALHWSHTASDPYRSVTRIASVTLKPVNPDGSPAG